METHGQLSPGPSSHLPEITEEPNYQAITEQKQQLPSSQHHQPSHHQPLSPRQSQQTMPPDSSAIIYQVWLSQCKAWRLYNDSFSQYKAYYSSDSSGTCC